ncbi:MAG: hypothetical protein H6839_10375 [Planctomycetes bacterium]|nr:hypothetical protein [Planctomycetota bacterium]
MKRLTIPAALLLTLSITALAAEPAPRAPEPLREQSITMLPQALTSFGAAVQSGYIYVIGGHTSAAHHYDSEGFNRQFIRLSLHDRTSWEVLPGGAALQSVALVSDGARLIRIGGMTALNKPGTDADLHSTTEVAAFDPLTRAWVDLPPLPEPRSSHDAVCVDGRVYVFGGWNLDGDEENAAWHDHGLVLDLTAEQPAWKTIKQPFVRRAVALAAANGRIYVAGGMTEKGMSRKVDIYDPAEDKWSEGPELPGRGFGSSAYGQDGRVYATTMEGELYSHAGAENEWRPEGTLTFPRFFLRLLGVGHGEFAAIAGTGSGGHVRNIEWLKPGQTGPCITRVTLPAPGHAKARQGVFVYNNALYVFGGNNSVKDHQFGRDDFSDEAFRISLNTLSAERIATLPVRRQSFLTFTRGTEDRYADKVGYAVGGFGYTAEGDSAVSHAEILEYSLEADVWSESRIKLPSPLTQFGVAQHDGSIYLFGGLDFDESRGRKERFRESDTIWRWNPKAEGEDAKRFVAIEQKLPTPRRAFGSTLLDGKFYIVGGMGANFGEIDRCDVYDIAKGEWSTIPAPSSTRLAPKLVALDGKLYLVGGSSVTEEGSFATDRTIEQFDPATGKWATIVSDLGEDLGEMQAFAFHNRLLIYSAHNSDEQIKLLFVEP